ncbi:MAG: hypothetical protein RIT07_519 [Bacteroidota bacterium]
MKRPSAFYFSLFTIATIFFNCSNPSGNDNPKRKSGKTADAKIVDIKNYIRQKGIKPQSLIVLIDKSEKTLSLMHKNQLLKTYPVALGSISLADKLREGDNLTPEGDFFIQSKYPHKSWKYFLWVNYPTNDSRKKHRQAKKAGLIPQNANIGGQIGIHGVVKGRDFLVSSGIPWTKGCISLKNADISELYEIIGTRSTLIRIQK